MFTSEEGAYAPSLFSEPGAPTALCRRYHQAALEALLGRPVDLVERQAVEASRNYIRRRRILAAAEAI